MTSYIDKKSMMVSVA